MPSPITTSGFRVQQMPGIQTMDPRLFTPGYGDIIPAVTQGARAGSDLVQIYDEAQARPIRKELQQIALDEARQRAIDAPLERAAKVDQIEQAKELIKLQILANSQPVITDEVVGVTGLGRDPVRTINTLYDPNDPSKGPEYWDQTPAGGPVDLYEAIDRTSKNLATGEETVSRRTGKRVSTAEQQKRAEDLAANNASLAAARIAKAKDAALKTKILQQKADAYANNPAISHFDKTVNGRIERHYFPKGKPGEVFEIIDRGEARAGTTINLGGLVPQSGGAPIESDINPEIANIARMFSGEQPAVAPPAALVEPEIAPPSPINFRVPSSPVATFTTIEEAQAAFASGQINIGDRITVGTQTGTWE